MRRSDQHEQKSTNPPVTAWLPVLAAVAIMATGCLSTFLVLQLDHFRPKVGDMVVFKPGSQDSDMWEMSIPATIVSRDGGAQGACTLDPNVMATTGGSLVVEARQEVPVLSYQVRWVGQRTTAKGTNCGSEAALTVSRTDLQRLANAAGGFGVAKKGIVR